MRIIKSLYKNLRYFELSKYQSMSVIFQPSQCFSLKTCFVFWEQIFLRDLKTWSKMYQMCCAVYVCIIETKRLVLKNVHLKSTV